MDLQGKVIAEMQERKGTSARGDWKAKDFVIETHEQYPHKMVFTVLEKSVCSDLIFKLGKK